MNRSLSEKLRQITSRLSGNLQYRHVLKPAPLRPRYMEHPHITEKLTYLRNGLTPLTLVETR